MAVNQDFKKSTVSTTNHTQNYDLPLWTGEDTTSWLTQMNDAMNKIDDGMVDAKSKALEVVGIAADAKKLADETKAESAASAKIVAGYNDRLTAAEEKIVEHTQDITNLNTRSDQFDVDYIVCRKYRRRLPLIWLRWRLKLTLIRVMLMRRLLRIRKQSRGLMRMLQL